MKRLLLLLLVWGVPSVAQATTYYVAKAAQNGSDSNNCAAAQSLSTPKLTINSVITNCALTGGDTVLIRVGTYAEGINNPTIAGSSWSSIIRFANYNGEVVWMAPTSPLTAVLNFEGTQAYLEFDGINTDGRSSSGAQNMVLRDTVHHIRYKNAEVIAGPNVGYCAAICGGNASEFQHLIIHGGAENLASGLCGPACQNYGFYTGLSNSVFEENEIYNTSGGGIQIYNGGGGTPSGNIIRNNRIHNLTIDGGSGGWCVIVTGNSNQIYNNLCYDIDMTHGSEGIDVFNGTGNKIWNNLIYDVNGKGIRISTGAAASTEVLNNIVYSVAGSAYEDSGSGTTCGGVCSTTNSITGANPLFTNAGAGDFTLQAGSPARNTGTTIATFSTDFIGTARPKEGTWDKGAYEYIANVGPLTYYVATTGTNTSCGAAQVIGTPAATVAFGIGCLSLGDTLLIRAGTYVENLSGAAWVSGTDWVTYTRIRAYPGETVWLAPVAAVSAVLDFWHGEKYIEFDGINIDAAGVNGIGIWIECYSARVYAADHLRFQNLTISNAPEAGIFLGADDSTPCGSNEFLNVTVTGTGTTESHIAIIVQSSNNVFERITLTDFPGPGFLIANLNGGTASANIVTRSYIHDGRDLGTNTMHGIQLGASQTGTVVENTIIDTIPNAASTCLYLSAGTLAVIRNNTLYNCDLYIFRIDAGVTNTTGTNNVMYGSAGTNYSNAGTGTTILTSKSDGVNPSFTNAPGGDFTVSGSSTLVDTGTTITGLLDFTGTARPLGAAFDIGAHERALGAEDPPVDNSGRGFGSIRRGRP